MPHQSLDSSVDESAIQPKLTGDVIVPLLLFIAWSYCLLASEVFLVYMFWLFQPAELAAKRAELHRQSIAKMVVSSIKECLYYLTLLVGDWTIIASVQINNMSVQDMHIFGDPSRIPVVIVEQLINVPLHSTSGNSYFSQMDQNDTNSLFAEFCSNNTNPLSGVSTRQNGRVLKIVVFVHGFQACSVMLIWKLINIFLILFIFFRHCL